MVGAHARQVDPFHTALPAGLEPSLLLVPRSAHLALLMSSQTKIKEALFEELVCSVNVRDIETIIKVIKSIENDERSSFMMEIIQKHETERN